jgi:hypothetical protein
MISSLVLQASLMNKHVSEDDDSRKVISEQVDSENRGSAAQQEAQRVPKVKMFQQPNLSKINSGDYGSNRVASNDPSSAGEDYFFQRKAISNGGLGSLRPHRVPLVPTGFQ